MGGASSTGAPGSRLRTKIIAPATAPEVRIHSVGSAGFRYWTAAEALRRSAAFWAAAGAKAWHKSVGASLPVRLDDGVDLNAYTNSDETGYFFSFPANRLELWAYLESERFANPVFRQFYKERDVVKEERRMRIESQPTGRLFEEFLAAAFKAHPYRHPVVGPMSDLDNFTLTDARQSYHQYYIPSNMVTAIVGDVTPAPFRKPRCLPCA